MEGYLTLRGCGDYNAHAPAPRVATHLNNLAFVYFDQYRYSKAEPLFVRALEIREKALGADDPELSLTLSYNNLGFLYVRWGRYENAQPLLRRALELEKSSSAPVDFFFATILNNLAELYLGLGEFDKAEELCKEGLGIREMINNPEKTGRSYITMATILLKKGVYDRSEEFFELALANREAVYSSNHPELIQTLTRYAELLRAIGRNDEATQMERRIEAIRSSYSIHDAY